jgi:hypothetical protein
MTELEQILERLTSEERDHEEIKEQAREAMILAKKVKEDADIVAEGFRKQLKALETKLEPLISVAPVMEDFAATGRVGYMLGKWIIGIAGFMSAAAVIYYAIVHGFRK